MRSTIALALIAPALATHAASAQHILVCDRGSDRVSLLDSATGALVDANYIQTGVLAAAGPIEAIRVNNEIWVSDPGSDSLRRVSLDGHTQIGTVQGPFTVPLDRPQGLATDGSTVYTACHFLASHGVNSSWITQVSTSGTNQGVLHIEANGDAGDIIVRDNVLWAVNDDTKAIERYTLSGAYLDTFATFGPAAEFIVMRQFTISPEGHVYVASSKGIWHFDDTGSLVERIQDTKSLYGVTYLDDGTLLTTGLGVHRVEPDGSLTTMLDIPAAVYLTRIDGATPCPADIAAPYGELNIDDVLAFVDAFAQAEPLADFALPLGTKDIDDVLGFVNAFSQGCP